MLKMGKNGNFDPKLPLSPREPRLNEISKFKEKLAVLRQPRLNLKKIGYFWLISLDSLDEILKKYPQIPRQPR